MNYDVNNFFNDKYKKTKISEKELKEAWAKAKFLGQFAKMFKDLIDLVKDAIKGEYKVDIIDLALLIGAIFYVLDPFDFIADYTPFVGFLDDSVVLSFVWNICKKVIEDWKKWKLEKSR